MFTLYRKLSRGDGVELCVMETGAIDKAGANKAKANIESPRQACGHGASGQVSLLFCGGYASDMTGTKSSFLHRRCAALGLHAVSFDYMGVGRSSGEFSHCTIGDWRRDVIAVLTECCADQVVIVGSSMGGWLALLAAEQFPQRVASLILLAPAPDFPTALVLKEMGTEGQAQLARAGVWHRPVDKEGDDPLPFWKVLFDESTSHNILQRQLEWRGRLRVLHGDADEAVPVAFGEQVLRLVSSDDAQLIVIKGGDHRLSSPSNLELLWQHVLDGLPP